MALVFLAACSGTEMAPPGGTAEARCAAWAEAGPAVPLDRAALETSLGPVDSVATTVEANRHIPDATDAIEILTWAGLTVTLRTPPDGRALVEEVIIRDDRFLRWPDPGIGDAVERVIAILGEPAERDATHLLYFCGEGPVREPVALELVDGMVSAVVFDYYVD